MSTEPIEALARRYWEDVVNRGKVDVLDEIFAADYVQHQGDVPPGLAGIKEFVRTMYAAFPDQHATVEDVLARGDRVMTRTTIVATHTGPLGQLAPTGNPVRVEVIDIWRAQDGKLAEHWGAFDRLAFMQQLGAIP
jgi:predicted ester cyclase